MSRLKKGENPTIFGGQTIPDENGKIEIPPEKSIEGVAPSDVRNNPINIQMGSAYKLVKKDGKIFRLGPKGIEYPPLTEKEFKEIQKSRKIRENESNEIEISY